MASKKQAKEKPLDKMTASELREIAKEMSEITGAHGMNKAELLSSIKEVRGISDPGKNKSAEVRGIKEKIKELKTMHRRAIDENDDKMAGIYRKRIIRLKKKTRRAA